MNFWFNALASLEIDLEEKHLYLECSWIHSSTAVDPMLWLTLSNWEGTGKQRANKGSLPTLENGVGTYRHLKGCPHMPHSRSATLQGTVHSNSLECFFSIWIGHAFHSWHFECSFHAFPAHVHNISLFPWIDTTVVLHLLFTNSYSVDLFLCQQTCELIYTVQPESPEIMLSVFKPSSDVTSLVGLLKLTFFVSQLIRLPNEG